MLVNFVNFHDQLLFFVFVFCWNNEYILDNISRICVQKVQIKNFSDNTFPIRTCIINLFPNTWEI